MAFSIFLSSSKAPMARAFMKFLLSLAALMTCTFFFMCLYYAKVWNYSMTPNVKVTSSFITLWFQVQTYMIPMSMVYYLIVF